MVKLGGMVSDKAEATSTAVGWQIQFSIPSFNQNAAPIAGLKCCSSHLFIFIDCVGYNYPLQVAAEPFFLIINKQPRVSALSRCNAGGEKKLSLLPVKKEILPLQAVRL